MNGEVDPARVLIYQRIADLEQWRAEHRGAEAERAKADERRWAAITEQNRQQGRDIASNLSLVQSASSKPELAAIQATVQTIEIKLATIKTQVALLVAASAIVASVVSTLLVRYLDKG